MRIKIPVLKGLQLDTHTHISFVQVHASCLLLCRLVLSFQFFELMIVGLRRGFVGTMIYLYQQVVLVLALAALAFAGTICSKKIATHPDIARTPGNGNPPATPSK